MPRRGECVEVKTIVHWMSQILLAAKIAFGGLHRRMAQQELNLFQFATVTVAQLRTGSPQVVRSNVLQPRSLATGTDYVPHHVLRDALPPSLIRSGNRPEDSSLGYSGSCRPLIECRLDPFRNRNGTNMTALADQIHDCPVTLPHLNLMHLQPDQLRPRNPQPNSIASIA